MHSGVEQSGVRSVGNRWRSIVARARGCSATVLVYALVLTLIGAALIHVAAGGVRSVTALIDNAIAKSVDELRLATAAQQDLSAGTQKERALRPRSDAADTAAFPHARPAPRFVERRDATEIEQLKQAVVERVVEDDPTPWLAEDVRTYRTMCVRLCDGAYFPISFATTRKRFAEDEAKCAARCGSPTRLFAFPNDGGSPDVMKDRSGRSYIALPTAFQFRKGSDAACTCRAAPWEEASKERHQRYALEEARDHERALAAAVAGLPANVTAAVETAPVAVTPVTATEARPTETAHREIVNLENATPIVTAALGHDAASARALAPEQTHAKPVPERIPNDPSRAAEPAPQGSLLREASDPSVSRVNEAVSKKASRLRKPATAAPAAPSLAAAALAAPAITAPGRIPPSVARLYKDKPIWGVGRNSHSSPRGGTAAETFARNFY